MTGSSDAGAEMSRGPTGTEIQVAYERPGAGTHVFSEQLVRDDPELKVLLQPAYEGPIRRVAGRVILETSAPILWFVFPGRWYSVGRFHRADRTFTGWYTNLCTPVKVRSDRWSMTDLFLDHWHAPPHQVWLDEDEFATAVSRGLLSPARTKRVRATQRRIERHLAAGRWPPEPTRTITLAEVRSG